MIKLAETYFRLDLHLELKDQVKLQSILTSLAYRKAEGLFQQTPEIVTYLEDGSLKGWLTVAGRLYIAIGLYGSFRDGIDHLVKDAQVFSEKIIAEVQASGISQDEILRTERRTGVPGRLKRVIRQIDQLESNRKDLSKTQYDVQLLDIREKLVKILLVIEDDKDRAIVLDALPENIRIKLPQQIPKPFQMLTVPVALRPEEYEPLEARSHHSLPVGGGLINPISVTPSNGTLTYYIIPATDGFKLVQR
jgi:hypothetical protein